MNKTDRAVKRISEMEAILDKANEIMDRAETDPTELLNFQPEIKKLEKYYTSRSWKSDFALDEAGKLPQNLKRGVLSEDGIYDLLERNKSILNTV